MSLRTGSRGIVVNVGWTDEARAAALLARQRGAKLHDFDLAPHRLGLVERHNISNDHLDTMEGHLKASVAYTQAGDTKMAKLHGDAAKAHLRASDAHLTRPNTATSQSRKAVQVSDMAHAAEEDNTPGITEVKQTFFLRKSRRIRKAVGKAGTVIASIGDSILPKW